MVHISYKPTKRFETNFDAAEVTKDIEIPLNSKEFIKEYSESDKLSDEYGKDLFLIFDKEIVYAFDYLYDSKKIVIPEINPVLIFYSNAILCHASLFHFKSELLKKSPEITKIQGRIHPADFADFAKLAVNCIVNLQGAIESFLNYSIPENHKFISKNKKEINRPSIHNKLDAISIISKKSYEESHPSEFVLIKNLIDLRNDIIHLKPIKDETNTKYKMLFRRMIDFDFLNATLAIRDFINYYESELIEECPCGKEYFYLIKS